MSRIGKTPVVIPQGVTVTTKGNVVAIKGPKGELSLKLPSFLKAEVKEGQVLLACDATDAQSSATYGTTRSLIANMVTGVHQLFSKDLELQGVGYRAALQGKKLVLSLGYSHPVEFTAPDGITLKLKENTGINVAGPDKHLVGQVAAQIRSFCPPEPYKGKGVRYKGEYVRRKVGKTVA